MLHFPTYLPTYVITYLLTYAIVYATTYFIISATIWVIVCVAQTIVCVIVLVLVEVTSFVKSSPSVSIVLAWLDCWPLALLSLLFTIIIRIPPTLVQSLLITYCQLFIHSYLIPYPMPCLTILFTTYYVTRFALLDFMVWLIICFNS